MNNQTAISAKALTKKFGSFTAVDSISFDVSKGEIFGFLGANGAGKTTAIKMFTGLLNPTSGEATVAGFDVFTETERIRQNIGYMSQKFSLYEDLTVSENIEFYGGIYGIEKSSLKDKKQVLLNKLGFSSHENDLIASIPLGWKQKLAFSIAVMHDPAIVFLDEPTGGVDPITRRQFWDLMYESANEGKTIFVTTHYMDEAEYCDRVSIMVDGRIAALGTPADLKSGFNVSTIDRLFVKLARPDRIEND